MKKGLYIFLCLLVLSAQFFAVHVFAAEDNFVNQKAYVEISLDHVLPSDKNVEFKFHVADSGVQKLNFFVVDEDWSNLSWENAPKNNRNGPGVSAAKAGSVIVTGSGEYTLDITDIAKRMREIGRDKITLAICGEQRNGFSADFSNFTRVTTTVNMPCGNDGDYILGGETGTTSAEIITDENGTNILHLVKSDIRSTYRYKFYNGLKKDGMLTEDDIGRVFHVSFRVLNNYTASKCNFNVGFMSAAPGAGTPSNPAGSSTKFVGDTHNIIAANADGWVDVSFYYTVTAETVSTQAGMLTFADKFNDISIKNLSVKDVSPGTKIYGAASGNLSPSVQTAQTDGSMTAVNAIKSAYIENEENRYNTMDGEFLYVNENQYRSDAVGIVSQSWTGRFFAGEQFGHQKRLRNNTGQDKNMMLALGVYDDSNCLVHTKFTKQRLERHSVIDIVSKLDLPADMTAGYVIKAFLWDGDSIVPVCQVEEYEGFYREDEVVVKVKEPAQGAEYASFDVFVKGTKKESDMYTMYRFQYIDNPSVHTDYTSSKNSNQNAKLYRVKTAFKAKRTGIFDFEETEEQLLQHGEIEMAVREKSHDFGEGAKSAGDFVGGYHGDEHITDVSLAIDGTSVPLDKAGSYRGEQILFRQDSIINRCNTPGDYLLYHIKDYTVTKDGIALHQKAEWLQDTTVKNAYLMMFTAVRQSGNTRITDYADFYWQDNTKAASYDLTDYGLTTFLSTGEPFTQPGVENENKPRLTSDSQYVNKAHLWSAAGDIDAVCTTQTVQGLKNQYAFLAVRIQGDNKCYFGNHENLPVKQGEIWEVKNTYDVKINN